MILETLASALLGLLGTGLTTYSNYKMEKLKATTQLEKLRLESELMIAEAEANIKVAQATSEIALEQMEAQAFSKSQDSQKSLLPEGWFSALFDQKGWLCIFTVPLGLVILAIIGIGDAINHLMRSALTLYSLGIASWVTYKSYEIMQGFPPSATLAYDGWREACEVVMLLAVTMVTWWFGDRRVAQHLMHMKGSKK